MISLYLRKWKLLYGADYIRFLWYKIKNKKNNRRFKSLNPNVALPPDYLIYESFQLNYEKYYHGGRETAKWLWGLIQPFLTAEKHAIKILDWGCGPGRIVRHIPELIRPSAQVTATDYNQKSIAWCKANLPNIQFYNNRLSPPLGFENQTFDCIYAISIFTHLSEEMHFAWWNEIMRILQPGGLFFFTTQGANFIEKLALEESKQYHSGRLVVRGQVKEGHRTFSAFHPPKFIEQLVGQNKVLRHLTPPIQKAKALPQDVWIVQKI